MQITIGSGQDKSTKSVQTLFLRLWAAPGQLRVQSSCLLPSRIHLECSFEKGYGVPTRTGAGLSAGESEANASLGASPLERMWVAPNMWVRHSSNISKVMPMACCPNVTSMLALCSMPSLLRSTFFSRA